MAVGCPHPDYLNAWLNCRQVAEWLAFASLEPITADRSDRDTAWLLSMIYEVNRVKGEKRGPDYFIKALRRDEQSEDEQWAILEATLGKR